MSRVSYNNQFRRDAAFISALREEYDAEEENHLTALITDEIYGRAGGVRAFTTLDTWEANMQPHQNNPNDSQMELAKAFYNM